MTLDTKIHAKTRRRENGDIATFRYACVLYSTTTQSTHTHLPIINRPHAFHCTITRITANNFVFKLQMRNAASTQLYNDSCALRHTRGERHNLLYVKLFAAAVAKGSRPERGRISDEQRGKAKHYADHGVSKRKQKITIPHVLRQSSINGFVKYIFVFPSQEYQQ